MLYIRLAKGFSKITKEQVKNSSYDELVDRITKQYNYQQFKNPSSLALLEVHHQYKLFKPGFWVLDIGAGPHWSWTELALKLTADGQNTNKVISNDVIENMAKNESIYVQGSFFEEQVKTKIAMHLLKKQLDVILIDATPEFSGSSEKDSSYIMQVFFHALQFANPYLKKGGTMVLRTVQSIKSDENEKKSRMLFNEVYKYRPATLRPGSPIYFYVLKGFMMNNMLEEVGQFFKQYKGDADRKISVVEKYKKMCKWDPVQMLTNSAKNRISELRKQGRTNKQIAAMYEDDPYVKIKQLLTLFDTMESKSANPIAKIKAKQKLSGGADDLDKLPETEEEFAEMIFSYADEFQKKGDFAEPKQKVTNQPLGDKEVYMKSNIVPFQEDVEKTYSVQDLNGYPISAQEQEEYEKNQELQELQLVKLLKSFPEASKEFERNSFQSKMFENIKEAETKRKQDGDAEMKMQSSSFDFNEEEDYLKSKQEEERLMKSTGKLQKKLFLETKPKKADRYSKQRKSKSKQKNPF